LRASAQQLVERHRAERPAVQRREHLHVAQRVQPEAPRDALEDERADRVGRRGRVVALDEEGLALRPLVEGRHLAGVQVVRHAHDAAVLGLPEDRREPRDGHDAAGDEGREHLAGPTEGSWSASPTRTRPAAAGRAATVAAMSARSTIEVSSDDEDVEVERLGDGPREARTRRLDAEQAVQRGGLGAGRLREPAGGAPGGRGEPHAAALADEHVEQQAHDRRLADARPAGESRPSREPRASSSARRWSGASESPLRCSA
jgi:hypothetical protein